MAPLNLTVRTSPRESFPLEIEDDETVESLAVAIYSLNPDLGEELRLAHKGRPLKDDQELKAAGIKSGDVIAVAKKVSRAPQPAAAPPAAAVAATPAPAMAAPPVKEAQGTTSESPQAPAKDLQEPGSAAEAAAPEAAKCDVPAAPPAPSIGKDEAGSADEPAAPLAAECAVPAVPPTSSAGDATAPVVPAEVTPEVTAETTPVPEDAHHGEAASTEMPTAMEVTAEVPAEPKEGEVGQDGLPEPKRRCVNRPSPDRQDAPQEAHVAEAPAAEAPVAEAPAAAQAAEASVPEAAAPASPSARQEPEEEISADALFAAALRLEAGDADAHPAELAALLRRAGTKMQAYESTIAEAGHALQLLNHFSAHSLRSLNNSMQGLPMPAQEPQEGTKSYLIKKGDADVQEAHRQAAQLRPSTAGSANSHSGGVLSSSSTPMTKEEMDRARKARLEKLEQQQADKKKAQEEAAARARAKEAMFEKPFAGASKPLGKF